MNKYIILLSNRIIEYGFYLLFFLTPLLLTTVNYELFEFNKMMFVYAVGVLIIGAWILKSLYQGLEFKKTPLFLPLIFFLFSQIISTIFSLDRYTSIWGYYSRFNGGLVSTICYLLLFFAFVSNFQKDKINRLFYFAIASATLVSLYGIAQRYGIDANVWVQDVRSRVFSTLGQPNWLAAYLNIIIFPTFGLLFNFLYGKKPADKPFAKYFLFIIVFIFYTALLFTRSRSGFLAFWIINALFWIVVLIKYSISKKLITLARRLSTLTPLKLFITINLLFLILNYFVGIPYNPPPLGKFSPLSFITSPQPLSAPPATQIPSSSSITDSGEIRKIIWKGAWEIIKAHPLIGTGVETFAYSYSQYKPVEHNLTSEWDFLYNKAHNEYLNIAANTGLFGLLAYLSIIAVYLVWLFSPTQRKPRNFGSDVFHFSLIGAWLSILITNFFGFSVVVINLFFFLIPAMSMKLITPPPPKTLRYNSVKIVFVFLTTILVFYFETTLALFWFADFYFNKGENSLKLENYKEAYSYLAIALKLNNNVPLYHGEISYALSNLAVKDANDTLIKNAIYEDKIALASSPNNINLYKSSAKTYFSLAKVNEGYLYYALISLDKASKLAPTDPKILYNIAVINGRLNKNSEAILILKKAVQLKPNYKDAHFALAIFYEEEKNYQMAKKHLEVILNKIDPADKEIRKKYDDLLKKLNH